VESSDYESGQIPGIPGANLIILPSGIILHRETAYKKIPPDSRNSRNSGWTNWNPTGIGGGV
jgi:hypothetical protein